MKRIALMIAIVLSLFIMVSCNMTQLEIADIAIINNGTIYFTQNEKADTSNILLNVTFDNGTTVERTVREHWITGLNTDKLGSYIMTIRYVDKVITIPYEVVPDSTPTLTFEVNQIGAENIAPITVEYGTVVNKPIDPVAYGYVFVYWQDSEGNKYDFTQPLTENKTLVGLWKKAAFIVTFVYDNGDEIEYEVLYNNLIPEFPANDFRKECQFLGWYNGEERFASYMEVKGNMTLKAKFERSLVSVSTYYMDAMAATLNKEFAECKYDKEENYEKIEELYQEYFERIKAEKDMDSIEAIFNEYCLKASVIPTYADAIEEYLNTIDKTLYYIEDYEEIKEIAAEAAYAIRSYMGGIPLPKDIYNNAIKSINKVNTIEEDNEAAIEIKAKYLRHLENLYNSIARENYTSDELTKIDNAYNEGISAIKEAIGTRNTAKAYAMAIEKLNALIK